MATQTISKKPKTSHGTTATAKQKNLKRKPRQLPHRKLHNALKLNLKYQKKTSPILTYHLYY